jgi:diguanylate cyclase (GGDEF)-like protein/PAS domain S-box-containing protein
VLFRALSGDDGSALGVAGLSAALLGLVVARLAGLVVTNERFVKREIALQAGAAALVAAGSREEIQRVGAATALQLAGGQSQAYTQLDLTSRPQPGLTDVVVVGSGELAQSVREEIRQSGSLGRLGTARTLVVPVVIRDRVQGILRVTGTRALPWHLRDGLSTLASQVALALEGAELTEDLLERRSEARFRSLVQNSNDLIAVLEPDLTIRYATPSVETLLGTASDAVVGMRLDELLHPDELEPISARLREEAQAEGRVELEFRLRHDDGAWRTVEGVISDLLEDPSVGGLVLTAHDVSDRRALEDQLTHQAFHDALTGLPNRALLTDRVMHALERARRTGIDLAVLFLDVDDFKTINDSLGHVAGDQLLVELARRLEGCLRGSDTAARLGGDEFAIVLEETNGIEGAARVASRILDAVAPPFTLGDTELLAHASIGIVLGHPGDTAGDLLRNADVAMYQAKEHGGNRFEVFRPEMHAAALTRLELKAELERAFHAEELDLHYQTLVELETGRIVGLEALLRWTHAVRGPISPSEFVPLAEETGLINAIGHWVMARACRQTREWQQTLAGCELLTANVNLSARQILQPGFRERITAVLEDSGLEPSHLVLEITESTLMEDVEGVSAKLAELRAMGVRIAIDDFGTGFSSLSYLQRFPVDELKIAKEFVDDVVDDPRKARLVEAIVRLAGSLDLQTVAEGIEEPAQRERLREMGCILGQGYLFARPVPAARVVDMFADGRATAA